MTRLRDPRLRIVFTVLLLLLTLGLAWHAVGIGTHAGMEMAGACLAVLVALGLVLRPPDIHLVTETPSDRRPQLRPMPLPRPPSRGRHPPRDCTVLRH